MEEGRRAFKILTDKPIEKRPLRRPWRRSMDFKEIGINKINWVDSAQERDNWRALVNMVLNHRVPYAM